MPDFSLSKIYKIWSPSTDAIYIGSTTQVLDKRLYAHKHGNKKCSSQVIIAFGDAKIELIEYCPCNCKIELNRREGEIQREHNGKVIIQNEGQTDTNKEKIKAQMQIYYQANKIKLNEYSRIYKLEHSN